MLRRSRFECVLIIKDIRLYNSPKLIGIWRQRKKRGFSPVCEKIFGELKTNGTRTKHAHLWQSWYVFFQSTTAFIRFTVPPFNFVLYFYVAFFFFCFKIWIVLFRYIRNIFALLKRGIESYYEKLCVYEKKGKRKLSEKNVKEIDKRTLFDCLLSMQWWDCYCVAFVSWIKSRTSVR